MTQQKFALECPQCGGTRFRASSAKPGPTDPVVCSECGTSINLQELKARLVCNILLAIGVKLPAGSGHAVRIPTMVGW